MKNGAFVIWAIGFPLMMKTVQYLSFLQGKVTLKSDGLPWITFIVWVFIAYLLYEPKE